VLEGVAANSCGHGSGNRECMIQVQYAAGASHSCPVQHFTEMMTGLMSAWMHTAESVCPAAPSAQSK